MNPTTTEHDLLVLGRLLKKFLLSEDYGDFVWLDKSGAFNRLVLDGSIWSIAGEELEVLERVMSQRNE